MLKVRCGGYLFHIMSTYRKRSSYRFLCTVVVPLCLACLLRTMNKSERAMQQNYAWRVCLLWQSALCRLWKDERHKTNSWIIKWLPNFQRTLYLNASGTFFFSQTSYPTWLTYTLSLLCSCIGFTVMSHNVTLVCGNCAHLCLRQRNKKHWPMWPRMLDAPSTIYQMAESVTVVLGGRQTLRVHGGCWVL